MSRQSGPDWTDHRALTANLEVNLASENNRRLIDAAVLQEL
jgi:hypothetical protein